MRDLSMTFVAAGEGETNNFLVPNGTFFVVLLIFLIVLGVIGTFVVPPIMRVLHERDEMVAKTIENNREADKQFAGAEADYEAAVGTLWGGFGATFVTEIFSVVYPLANYPIVPSIPGDPSPSPGIALGASGTDGIFACPERNGVALPYASVEALRALSSE